MGNPSGATGDDEAEQAAVGKLYSGARRWLAGLDGVRRRVTLHVKGVGIEGWDGTRTGTGTFEDETVLQGLFAQHGEEVSDVSVKHKIKGDHNKSWAVVAVRGMESAERLLAADIVAGSSRLQLTLFTMAETTSGLMQKAAKKDFATSDMRMMEKVFAAIDDDQTGEFNRDKFEAGLIKMNIKLTGHEIDSVLSRLDKDGGGSIDIDEFCEQMEEIRGSRAAIARSTLSAISNHLSRSGETAAETFSRLDDDGSGDLDLEEFHAALATMGIHVSLFGAQGESAENTDGPGYV